MQKSNPGTPSLYSRPQNKPTNPLPRDPSSILIPPQTINRRFKHQNCSSYHPTTINSSKAQASFSCASTVQPDILFRFKLVTSNNHSSIVSNKPLPYTHSIPSASSETICRKFSPSCSSSLTLSLSAPVIKASHDLPDPFTSRYLHFFCPIEEF